VRAREATRQRRGEQGVVRERERLARRGQRKRRLSQVPIRFTMGTAINCCHHAKSAHIYIL